METIERTRRNPAATRPLTQCTICGSASVEPAFSGGAVRGNLQDGTVWSVVRCTECSHRFMNPEPTRETLEWYYAQGYDAYETDHAVDDGFEPALAEARRTGTYRHVQIRPGMRILDVGCGGGSFLRVAAALGAEVQGVEPSPDGVASCRANGVPVFHGMLGDFLKTDPAPFDLVTANHVVEHHPDPVALLADMARLTGPDGRIWIAVPNAGCFFARALRDRWHSCNLPLHLQQFTDRSVVRAFEAAGLAVDGTETVSQNSLVSSLAILLRRRALVPGRLTRRLLSGMLSRTGALGRRIDAAGQGEALIVTGRRRPS
jgi:2-polyprenyl-3-methyl-5-hydroxy-6-metoxy-1,4-benzoquinol methylase